ANIKEELLKRLRGLKITIMWGTRDDIVSGEEMKRLASITAAKLIEVEGVGHANYLERPDLFKRELEVLLKSVG
ncbi:MAG: alpha/beta hydrolase, partial [Pyrodictiaceae archaeon]